MTKTIDANEAITLLQKAVTEKGEDYVYPKTEGSIGTCVYVRDGQPSCIVGHVINYLDPKLLAKVGEWEQSLFDDGDPETNVRELQFVLSDHGVVLTEDAVDALSRAQDLQDSGEPWGDAVRKARDYIR